MCERCQPRLVAILTGSKNALEGIGYFVGVASPAWVGSGPALWSMTVALAVALVAV